MDPIITENVGTNIVVKWHKPYDNSATITKYRIVFRNQLSQLLPILTHCDGADPTIISTLSCTIPMTVFNTHPFFLSIGDLIAGQAEAYNNIGYSNPSNLNIIGALYQDKPQVAASALTIGLLSSKTAI